VHFVNILNKKAEIIYFDKVINNVMYTTIYITHHAKAINIYIVPIFAILLYKQCSFIV
jgi:hypothetical protein